MGLRHICQRLGKLGWRLLTGSEDEVPNPNHIFESGNRAMARSCEQDHGLEQRFEVPDEVNGQGTASSTSMQPKTDAGTGVTTPAKKHLCAGDIARGILGGDSGVAIRNVLVVGTNGSTPLKRMEIHFEGPEQVPVFFNSLAAALKNSGVQFHAAWSQGIPSAEIWLTYPVNNGNKTLLSCPGLIGDQVAARTAAEAGSPQQQTE